MLLRSSVTLIENLKAIKHIMENVEMANIWVARYFYFIQSNVTPYEYFCYSFEIICAGIKYFSVDSTHRNAFHKDLIIKHLSACYITMAVKKCLSTSTLEMINLTKLFIWFDICNLLFKYHIVNDSKTVQTLLTSV